MNEHQGTVKWFDPNKGFGFISGGPEGDVFIHQRNLTEDRDELIEGQEVLFQVRPSTKGSEAFDVRVIRESNLPPRPRQPRGDMDRGPRPFSNTRPPRRDSPTPFFGNLPKGPITCTVVSRDREDRFMFVRSEREDFEIFVHGSLFRHFGTDVRRGDRVRVTVEQGQKGLRATSLDLS